MTEENVHEINVTDLLSGIGKLIEQRKEKEMTTERLVSGIDNVLRKVLPGDFKDITVEWQDPNKVIVTFNKIRLKQKMYKVLETV